MPAPSREPATNAASAPTDTTSSARGADPDVTGVYTAEDRLARWLELGAVTVFGSRWVLEPEVVFARVDDAQRYVDRVLAHLHARGWHETEAALTPVTVRERRGARKAHYEQHKHTIAIPGHEHGGAWALRESVVLHELAHHLCAMGATPPRPVVNEPDPWLDQRERNGLYGAPRAPDPRSARSTRSARPTDQPAHGPLFRHTLLTLLTEAGHPTAATLLGIAFADEGLA